MEKKQVAPILKKMNIGDKENYPMRRFTVVKTTIERIQKETGMKFSYRTIGQDEFSFIEITRIT